MLDTRFLQSLITVIEQGSIAEAARSLNLTPAAIGQRIRALEADLNTELLIRTGHKARPTEACIQLLPQMREIILKCRDLEFGWDPKGLSGVIRVGAISTALTGLVSSAIRELRHGYPQMQIHLFPGTSKELHRQVIDGDLDLAVIVSPPTTEKSLFTEALYREPLVLVTPDSPSIAADIMLRTAPFIAYDPASWGGLIIQRYLDRIGLKPNVISVLDSPEAIAFLVGEGLGVSIMPDWGGLNTQARKLRLTPLPDLVEQRVISSIYRHDSSRIKKIELFNTMLRRLRTGDD
ncbi:MAG: LysR family transcriptional regulator [Rhodobacteraceae bacterium]|nr:LysR family transcriptional regulator [Paracoccaceae bacterium]